MNSQLKLSIFGPERALIKDHAVEAVFLTTSEGEIEILPEHVNMIGTLETGTMKYKDSQGVDHLGVISTGFFEVQKDHVTVTAETLELSSEIDFDRAQKAQEKAEKMITTAEQSSDFKKAQLKLQRSLIRQQAAKTK